MPPRAPNATAPAQAGPPRRWACGRVVRALLLATAPLVTAVGALAADDSDAPPPIVLGRSVLKLEARRVQGGYSLGSAVVVAPGELVTNCHVTRDADLLQVMYGGERWTVRRQVVDLDHDLCLLRLPDLPAAAVALGDSATLQEGQRVHAVGFTGGMALQASNGRVVALHRLDGAQVVQVDNWFSSGASGGALFDAQQRLVGVLTFRLLGGQAHYFAAPVEWVRSLHGQADQPVAPLPAQPLPYWQRAADGQPRFLRAQRLLRDGQWDALALLADDWLSGPTRPADHATDPEPWLLAGLAHQQLGRQPEARRAIGCALQIAPGLPSARQLLAALPAEPAAPSPATPPVTHPEPSCASAPAR